MSKINLSYTPHIGFCPSAFTVGLESSEDAIELGMMLIAYQSFLAANSHSQYPKSRIDFLDSDNLIRKDNLQLVSKLNSHKNFNLDFKELENISTSIRIFSVPQVPSSAFFYPAKNDDQAILFLNTIAEYDNYLFSVCSNMRVDYSSASGAEIFEGNEWSDWYKDIDGEYFDDIYEYFDYLESK